MRVAFDGGRRIRLLIGRRRTLRPDPAQMLLRFNILRHRFIATTADERANAASSANTTNTITHADPASRRSDTTCTSRGGARVQCGGTADRHVPAHYGGLNAVRLLTERTASSSRRLREWPRVAFLHITQVRGPADPERADVRSGPRGLVARPSTSPGCSPGGHEIPGGHHEAHPAMW
ncbi:hypothetical protein LV779_14030 [Streptomyces thinghirensis]|nr:hypothetical protein [Streptomyces thinghirensis]